MALQLDRMTFDEVKAYLRSGPGIAILPVGATEQHGVHGALGTDTFAATCITLKVAERVNGVVLPALAYGNSAGHRHWPGTIGLSPSLLASLARTVCEACIEHGFSVVLMISGHRGNDPALDVAATEARRDRRARVLSMSYQDANKGRIHEIVGSLRGGLPAEAIRYGSDGHGGAVESSIAMVYDAAGFRPEKFAKPDRHLADARRGLSFKQTMFTPIRNSDRAQSSREGLRDCPRADRAPASLRPGDRASGTSHQATQCPVAMAASAFLAPGPFSDRGSSRSTRRTGSSATRPARPGNSARQSPTAPPTGSRPTSAGSWSCSRWSLAGERGEMIGTAQARNGH